MATCKMCPRTIYPSYLLGSAMPRQDLSYKTQSSHQLTLQTHPTHLLAFWNTLIHGPYSPHSSCTLAGTQDPGFITQRSGCGIIARTLPSFDRRPGARFWSQYIFRSFFRVLGCTGNIWDGLCGGGKGGSIPAMPPGLPFGLAG